MFDNAQRQELLWNFPWKENPACSRQSVRIIFSIIFVCFMLGASEI